MMCRSSVEQADKAVKRIEAIADAFFGPKQSDRISECSRQSVNNLAKFVEKSRVQDRALTGR